MEDATVLGQGTGAVTTAVITGLIVVGIVALIVAAWIAAVDVALGRITAAYAEDLVEAGRRRAPQLLAAVTRRKAEGATLATARVLTNALGTASLAVAISAAFWQLDWPWWSTIVATFAIIAALQMLVLAVSVQLNVGSRYVNVALLGSSIALRAPSRGRRERSARKRREGAADARSLEDATQARLAGAEQLRELFDEVSEDGQPVPIEDEDREILRSALELGQTRVGEVMVPRAEMVTVRRDDSARSLLDLFVNSGYSRLPVVGKSLDDIYGVVYLKDVLRRTLQGEQGLDISAEDIARPAEFVPEMKAADDELRSMQAANTHLALVVDEYGGIAGLVTAEDIIEELVGELVDEHDIEAPGIVEESPGCWLIPTSYHIDDLEDLLDVHFDEDDLYSAGGLLTKALGRVPLPGDQAELEGIVMEAGESTGRRRRVLTMRVHRADGVRPHHGGSPDAVK